MSAIRYSKITIRQPRELKANVEQAAATRGMTVTSYVNEAIERAAERTLSRVRARELTDRDSRALLAMLLNPARPNATLRAAAARATAEFDRPFVIDQSRAMTRAERREWNAAKRKREQGRGRCGRRLA